MPILTSTRKRPTTVHVPEELLEAADAAIRAGKARNRNEMFIAGLKQIIDQINRETIDAEFASMATDVEYQREAEEILAEFATAKWEAFQLAEAGL